MEAIYTPRFQGQRWTILFGSYSGTELYAVDQAQKLVQKYLPYVVRVLPADEISSTHTDHLILIGTPGNNPQINALLTAAGLQMDLNDQAYLLACTDSPWIKGGRVLLVAGRTSRGVLHAVQDLGKYLTTTVATKFLTSIEGRPDLRKSFDFSSRFSISGISGH